jgi:hypothetical protein
MPGAQTDTAKRLEFDVTAPLSMGLAQGKRDFHESDGLSPSLRFTVRPVQFPRRQTIWLAPKGGERDARQRAQFDAKTWRRLTPEIEGSLSFVTRGLGMVNASKEPTTTIGTLSHGQAYSSAEYGHGEFYEIEINITDSDFNQIRDIFLSGKSPSGISIWSPDIEYGNAPDGSDKVWEIETDSHGTVAKIVGFSLGFSTDIPRVDVGLKKTEGEEENEREETAKLKQAILHSREDIQLLCFGQAALNSSVVGLRRQVYILIAVAIVIAIFTALHLKF